MYIFYTLFDIIISTVSPPPCPHPPLSIVSFLISVVAIHPMATDSAKKNNDNHQQQG